MCATRKPPAGAGQPGTPASVSWRSSSTPTSSTPTGSSTSRCPRFELEGLSLGVQGKAAAFRTLRRLADTDTRLHASNLDELIARAERQSSRPCPTGTVGCASTDRLWRRCSENPRRPGGEPDRGHAALHLGRARRPAQGGRRRRGPLHGRLRTRPGPTGDDRPRLVELQVRWPNVPIVFCETRPWPRNGPTATSRVCGQRIDLRGHGLSDPVGNVVRASPRRAE